MHVSAWVMGFLGRAERILEANDCHVAMGLPLLSRAVVREQPTGDAPQDTLHATSIKRH